MAVLLALIICPSLFRFVNPAIARDEETVCGWLNRHEMLQKGDEHLARPVIKETRYPFTCANIQRSEDVEARIPVGRGVNAKLPPDKHPRQRRLFHFQSMEGRCG